MSKVYSQQEKIEALKLMKEVGTRTASERLGISQDTLYTWASKERKRKEAVNAVVAEKGPEGLVAEVEQLRKELAERDEEVEILKDALGFFAKRRKKQRRKNAWRTSRAAEGCGA